MPRDTVTAFMPAYADSPDRRYAADPEFRQLVDLLQNFIARAQYSPSELREAAIYAAIRYEMTHIRPLVLGAPPPGYWPPDEYRHVPRPKEGE